MFVSQSPSVSLIQVKSKDLDGSFPNNHVVYRILNGGFDKFTIDPESGIISVARGASLDPDLTQAGTTKYSLTVVAFDGASGDQQHQTSITVNVNVIDVNNKKPTLVHPGTISVQENAMVGKFYVAFE